MGRSLTDVPLDVLREQVRDIGYLLAHREAIAAFAAVGVDAGALAEEVRAAIEGASAAILAVGLAEGDRTVVIAERAAWKAEFAAWGERVRTELDARRGLPAELVTELKRRLGKYAGRNFAPSRDSLELTIGALRAHRDTLAFEDWYQDPIPPGEQLLASAERLVARAAAVDRTLADRRATAAATRRGLQHLVRDLQARWRLIRSAHPEIPDLELEHAARYLAARRRPESASAPITGPSAPITDLPMPSTGLSAPVTGLSVPVTGLSVPIAGPFGGITGIRVGIEVVDGRAHTGDGHQHTGDGRAQTDDGRQVTGDGYAQIGDGRAQTGDGQERTGDGHEPVSGARRDPCP